MQFTLGHPKDCVYVVPVKNITDSLFVFDDYGNDGLIHNNLSLEDIRGQNMIDNTMYAVVHTAT